MKPDYDTTIARMAGNIAGGLASAVYEDAMTQGLPLPEATETLVGLSVRIARDIVAEVKRTQLMPTALDRFLEGNNNAPQPPMNTKVSKP